jgi:hypothetical protein
MKFAPPFVLRARNPESRMTPEEAQQYYLDHIKGRVPPDPGEETSQKIDGTKDTDNGLGSGENRLILMTD